MLAERTFEKLGINVKLLGFGCMRFPTINNEIDSKTAQKMIDEAYQKGVNYFDTAYVYHNGKSEEFIGKALSKYPRSSYYIATKLPMFDIEKKEDVRRIIEEQFKRLNKDYIDFYLLHSMQKSTFDKAIEFEALKVIEEYKKQGKIKYIGFSFHDSYEVFEKIINYYPWDFCQIQFNYVDTNIQAGLKGLKLAEKLNIPLVVMEPIKGGSLASLPTDVSAPFRKIHHDWSDASWALRFVASFKNVKVILSGMSTYEQVLDNLNTFDNLKELTQEELETIKEVSNNIQARTKNGCTGCKYCMPCPAGVDIPKNFLVWNTYFKYMSKQAVSWELRQLKMNDSLAKKCVECGKCEKVCPQHINIRKDLKELSIELKELFK